MKSIKEKSNEYAKEYLFSPLPQRAPNIHFEAGANYVLEELEKVIRSNSSCEKAIFELGKLVIQLKREIGL